MTYEEVIEQLQDEKEEIEGSGFGNCSVESFDIAIEALEKQIPKKPIRNTGNINKHWIEDAAICPDCHEYVGNYVLMGGENFCPNCGQAILWEECDENH